MTNALPLPHIIPDAAIQEDLDVLALDAGSPRAYNRLVLTNSVKYTDMAKDANGLAVGAFRAGRATTQTLTDATYTDIVFATEAFDPSNAFSTSTGKWTCPVKGYYWFAAQVTVTGTFPTGKRFNVNLRQNGTIALELNQFVKYDGGGSYVQTAGGAGLLLCALNDVIHVDVFQDSGSNQTVSADAAASYFQGHLVGLAS